MHLAKPKNATVWLLLIFMMVVGGVVIYTLFDPIQYAWMPKCPFRLLTGWNCPACGIQRAAHALLHGRFAEAFSYNYFFVISIPYLLVLLVAEVLKRTHKGENFVRASEHPYLARIYIILFFVWGVLRNVFHI
ncbi:MAG: DUF2752 domain-containing protein [Bacteroidaceae bacterium]|nr:DUF2752 domain-containing protein [Bacteroidaceae bacterium]